MKNKNYQTLTFIKTAEFQANLGRLNLV